MPRPRSEIPSYRLHRQSGQAVVTVRNPDGTRRDVLLGRYGSPESKQEYERVLTALRVGHQPGPAPGTHDLTMNELMLRFMEHADRHYRRADGTPTNEIEEFRQTFKPVKALYGHTPAREFGPLALKAVRDRMVGGGLSRRVVNARVNRVRRAMKWATSEELVPAAAYHGLATVSGLQAGRTAAPDPEPVTPVPREQVEATLPHLNRHVAGLVRFQVLTGCRPGEACVLRRCDIDTSGAVWVFTPRLHKTRHSGRTRQIAIGPRAQELVRQFFTPDIADYLFSPRRAVEEFHAQRSAARTTPKYPSHMRRNAEKRTTEPGRPPAERYTNASYCKAVARAVVRANGARNRAGADGTEPAPVPHWSPNQLRHLYATEQRKRYGLEAAQVLLGHARADVTQVYAERDLSLAVKVAAEVG